MRAVPTTRDDPTLWRVAAGDPTLVCVPGIVKPIKVGNAHRAEYIVRAVNGFQDMLSALLSVEQAQRDGTYADAFEEVSIAIEKVRGRS